MSSKPEVLRPEVIAMLNSMPGETLAALAKMSPEGLAKVDRDAQRNARIRASYDRAGQAASDALAARMKAPPLPHLADHGHRLASLLPAGAVAFSQGGQAGHRELKQRDRDLIERGQSEIGAVRAAEPNEIDHTVIANPAFGGMKLAHLSLSAWSSVGQCFLFWYAPKLETFILSDLQLHALARFVKGGEIAITVAEFDMATEIEAWRRGQRKTDPRKDAKRAELERQLAELH